MALRFSIRKAPYDGIIRIRLRVRETSISISADFRVSTPVVFFRY